MEYVTRTGFHDLNLASRKAEEAGWFPLLISFYVSKEIEKKQESEVFIYIFSLQIKFPFC